MKEDPFKSYNPLGLSNSTEKRKTPTEQKAAQEKLHIEAGIARPEDWEKLRDLRLAILDSDGEVAASSEKEILKIKKRTDQEWKNVFFGEGRFSVLVSSGSETAGMGRANKYQGHWYLFNLGVKKEFRGIGLGATITALRLQEIGARGGKEVYAFVKDGNIESIKNAESFGFRRINTLLAKMKKAWNSGFALMKLDDVNAPEVVERINEVLNAR